MKLILSYYSNSLVSDASVPLSIKFSRPCYNDNGRYLSLKLTPTVCYYRSLKINCSKSLESSDKIVKPYVKINSIENSIDCPFGEVCKTCTIHNCTALKDEYLYTEDEIIRILIHIYRYKF